MKNIIIALLISITAISTRNAYSCECFPTDMQELIQENDQLIVATAKSKPWTFSRAYEKYRFKVDRILRGGKHKNIAVFTGKHSCGAFFVIGRTYLMVVSKEGYKFVTNQCYYWESDSLYAENILESFGK